MAVKKYKETQKFGYPEVWLLLGGLQLGLTIRFFQHLLDGTYYQFPLATFLLLSAPLIALMVYLWKVRVEVRISAKKIAVRMRDWYRTRRQKIHVSDIEEIRVVDTPEALQWVGGNIAFDHAHQYSLHGRKGVYVRTRDGEEYFIGISEPAAIKPLIEKIRKKMH